MIAVSVLIRTTGRQAALKDALDSLRAQHWKDFEAVVVEDGPATLGTFLSGYKEFAIRYEALNERKGRSVAGNRAMTLAQGEYFLFLDEDDLLYPGHLQALVKAARAQGRKIVHSWSEERPVERSEDGSIVRKGRFRRFRRERFSLLHLVAGNFLPINVVLFHRSLFEKAGGLDEDIDCLEDWLLWLRYAALEPEWHTVPCASAVYHVPLDLGARRRAFRAWHEKVNARVEKMTPAWPLAILRRDLKCHFAIAIFLRKLYYHLTGYIGRIW